MKRSTILISFLCIFFSIQADIKPWTFLVYMAAANDLSEQALYDLKEMTKVGSSQKVNILVYLTLQQEGQPKRTKKLYIEKEEIKQIGPDVMRDSGDLASLAEALQWACLDYPSEHIAVVLWGHGFGPLNRKLPIVKGVCYDKDTGHYLTDKDCLNAFLWVKDNIKLGKKFDIIACDACLLASLEMAYTFSSCADYLVASEETIHAKGFQYSYLLQALTMQEPDVLSCAKLIVAAYEKELIETENYTMSLTDLNAVSPLVDNINAIAQLLSSLLKGKKGTSSKVIIKRCVNANACLSFDNGIYLDLYQFYKNLLKNFNNLKLSKSIAQQFKQLLSTGIALFPKVIRANVTSKGYKLAGGLSIYFSKHSIDPSYYGLHWTVYNPNWLSFLESYIG